ncbi:hypothetical protein IY974_07420 [Campylobacter volucris]|uniref:hypothetical protein n=1 Tax=Campylobacter volucris TaxID=1031542 RepID=UPI00140504BB|nr:hypothetical protein [Campylobacter volucris]MBF7046383.1 hypothetical protein [Campylobacter volucris]
MFDIIKYILTRTDDDLLTKNLGYNNVDNFKNKSFIFKILKHTKVAFKRAL